MTNWEYWLDRRKKNIGYITKTDAFREPTPGEKSAALQKEIQHWQSRHRPFSISAEYQSPLGHGINLKRTRDPGGRLNGPEYTKAIDAYVHTPMDHFGILKAQGIDVSKWERKPTIFHKIWWKILDWFHKENEDYEPQRTRLTKEFTEMFSIKEKK